MTKAETYYDLVCALFKHRNQKDLSQLIAEIIAQLWTKGYDATFTARFLERTLRDEADRLRTFGE